MSVIAAVVLGEKLENDFKFDHKLTEESTGGTLEVHSRGQFSNIIDLDKADYVKVCMRRRAQVGYWQCTAVDSSLI